MKLSEVPMTDNKNNLIEFVDKVYSPTMKYVGQWNPNSQTFACYQVSIASNNILTKDIFSVEDIMKSLRYNHDCENISLFSKNTTGLTFTFNCEKFKKFVADNEIALV